LTTPDLRPPVIPQEITSRLRRLASVLKARIVALVPIGIGLGIQVFGGPELAALVLIGVGLVVAAGADFSMFYAATRLVEVPALAAHLGSAPRWMALACAGELLAVYRFFWRMMSQGEFSMLDAAFILAVASLHAAAHGMLIAGSVHAVRGDARAWAVAWMVVTATLVGGFILGQPMVALIATGIGCFVAWGAASRVVRASPS
jgi:hypothetical protein